MIYFNIPYQSGKEWKYILKVLQNKTFTGKGIYTKKCTEVIKNKYNINHVYLTNSCTSALEMAALLLQIEPGDEIIIPSFTFVSTANAFMLRGAKIIFADSNPLNPNIDEDSIEKLITPKTKAIVCVHYAGVACNMDKILHLAKKYNIHIVEDAAQCINAYYLDDSSKKIPLGSMGIMGTVSFHQTKNIHCGEGGVLFLNEDFLKNKAEYVWDKGTNRFDFERGLVEAYDWVELGSSYIPPELSASFLYAQILQIDKVTQKRLSLWNRYYQNLAGLTKYIKLPYVPKYAQHNAHIFYILLNSKKERNELIEFLKRNKIQTVFHYQSLHLSDYYKKSGRFENLPNSEFYSECLLRLPMHYSLNLRKIDFVCSKISEFYDSAG